MGMLPVERQCKIGLPKEATIFFINSNKQTFNWLFCGPFFVDTTLFHYKLYLKCRAVVTYDMA